MDRAAKRLWLNALRGGEYQQGTHLMRLRPSADGSIGPRFDVLGVLCEQYRLAHDDSRWHTGVRFVDVTGDGSSVDLPQDVLRWAGLTAHSPQVMFLGVPRSLAQLNDRGLSFDTLADLIEQQL